MLIMSPEDMIHRISAQPLHLP